MLMRSILAGAGGYLPERIVTNDELARTVDTTDAWIQERTGIRQRHFAGPHETAAFMGTAAARAALTDAGATADDVLQLISLIQGRARDSRQIDLHTEVIVLGEEN